VWACALLACIVLLLFARAPLSNGVLAPTDSIFLTPFFADQAPAGFRVPGNPILVDQVYQFVPWRRYAWASLRQGQLPLWNPYSHAGAPLVATMSSAVFYPINLLLSWLPFEQTFAWSAVLRFWIAGVLTYLLARQYRLGQPAALVSGVAFMLSGFLVVWLGHPQTNVAVWLPGLILLDELLLTAPSRAHRVRYAVLLGLIVGVQFTGGHAETSADVLVCASLYHVLRWSQVTLPGAGSYRTKLGRLLLLPSLAVFLGVALASIQLFPFLEWLPLSAEFHARAAESGFQIVRTEFLGYLFFLPLAVFPNLYGNPTWPLPPNRSLLPWGQNFNEDLLYVGILPLILAIMALLTWRRRPPPLTVWAVLGAIGLGRSLQLPIFDWINQLPLLGLGNPHRQRLIWSLSVALLAGFGAQSWWSSRERRSSRHWLWLNVAVVALGVALAVGGAGVLPQLRERLTEAARHTADIEFARTRGSIPLSLYYERADQAVTKLLWSFRLDNISMYMPALVSAAALALTAILVRGRVQRWSALAYMVVLLSTLDLTAFAWRYNPVIPAREFYPTPRLVSQLAADTSLFRFSATNLDLFPDAQMMYNLSDVRSLDFSTRWYSEYVSMIPETVLWSTYGTTFKDFKSPLLRVLNLKYVFSTSLDSPSGASADVIASTTGARAWRLQAVQPRSFVVRDAVTARNDREAVRLLQASPDAVYHRVVLSTPGPLPPMSPADARPAPGSGQVVTAVSYGPSESVWQVQSPEPGYLVTTDAYYPGWRAYVDGKPAPIYRANLAFRALRIPPGEHRVVYRYQPTWLPFAALLELLSSLAIVAGLVWSSARIGKASRVSVDPDRPPVNSTRAEALR
jgi:Bacterial membrane protein YfhO